MTLYDAVLNALRYAAQDDIDPDVLRNVLGGRPKEVWVTPGQIRVVMAYPGWEMSLIEVNGHVSIRLHSGGAPSLEVKVADLEGDWRVAFTRMVYTVLEVMGVKA